MISAHISLVAAMLLAEAPFFGVMASFLCGAVVLTGIFFHFVPELTRHDLFFAVTVDQGYYRRSEDARRILRQFQAAAWIHTGVGLAIVFAGAATRQVFVPLFGILWQVTGITIAFLRARRQVMPHAVAQTPHREAPLARRRTSVAYWILQAVPFAILCACGIYLRENWERIPERFPIHWGLNGEPNGWATRSFGGVYGLLMIGLVVCIFVGMISYGVVHWTRQIRSTGAGAAAEIRSRRIQVGSMLGVEYFLAAVFGGGSLIPLRSHPGQAPSVGVFLLGTLLFVIALYAVFLHTGQGGANLMKAAGGTDVLPDARVVGDRTPDECWKAGMFYVNRGDPALLVEKRFGIGYTLNFGRPAAWVLTTFFVLFMAVIPLLAVSFSSR